MKEKKRFKQIAFRATPEEHEEIFKISEKFYWGNMSMFLREAIKYFLLKTKKRKG